VASVLLPAAQAGLDAAALDPERAVPVDDAAELVAQAVRERRTVVSTEATSSKALAGRSGLGQLVAVPLIATDEAGGEEAEGVLLAAVDAAEQAGDADDTLIALADLCAVAIRNARLQHALSERADWMERMASTDTLTGLANRATVMRMLELEIARATRQGTELSLVIFDVDGFAELNERAGAEVGDDVLRLVASTLADQVRLVDTIGRYGPDEFLLIAPGSGGAVVARRVQEAARAIEADGQPISLGVGSVTMPAEGATAEGLVAAASEALAEAQRRGRGQLAGAGEA